MSQQHKSDLSVSASHRRLPSIELEYSLPSEVAAISSFIEKFIVLVTNCRCIPGSETDVEIALREALENAVVHGNRGDPRKHVSISCRCEPDELSIAIRDEGLGFDIDKVADPTAPEDIQSSHGRGIYLMKAFMDEVRFEEGGVLVRMRKCASSNKNSLGGRRSCEPPDW